MENLKFIRRQRKMTQLFVANQLNVSESAVSCWESGKNEPDLETIKKLANLYGVSVEYLIGQSLTSELPPAKNVLPLDRPIRLAVYGEIRAGEPINTNQSPTDEWIYEDERYAENHFVLKVKGDSMINAGITDGCLAIIKAQNYAESGQIVACIVDGENATLKRYLPQANGTVLLQAENPNAKSYVLTASDVLNGTSQIIGILREIKKRYY